ncbi:MAG: stage 0 sporulation family protein [Clostridia bacterium]|nr:stage 0 sporulation family protein [Clostridia bacterium]
MVEIIGVRFKNISKTYSFSPAGQTFRKGDRVIVETARGLECGEVSFGNCEVNESEIVQPLKSIVRAATAEDLRRVAENEEKEERAFGIFQDRIAASRLDMKLVGVEYTFDGSKIIAYFTADGRVDFRELVKDLASVFHTRIELRQIGVRDEAKMLGGLGICGRPFCCKQFLPDFQPLSIKMAKEQGLSLNPTKISGSCGRLMCCLKYEQNTYSAFTRITPKNGAQVITPEGAGIVTDANVLTGAVKVRLQKSPDSPPVTFSRDDLTLVNGQPLGEPKDPNAEPETEPVLASAIADEFDFPEIEIPESAAWVDAPTPAADEIDSPGGKAAVKADASAPQNGNGQGGGNGEGSAHRRRRRRGGHSGHRGGRNGAKKESS